MMLCSHWWVLLWVGTALLLIPCVPVDAFQHSAGRWILPVSQQRKYPSSSSIRVPIRVLAPVPVFQGEGRHDHSSRTGGVTILEASRRDTLRTMLETTPTILALLPTMQVASAAAAADEQPQVGETVVLRARVTVPPDFDAEPPRPSNDNTNIPALYITCRPDKPDNVPAAILNGSRGKPPPVLSARLSNPQFPLDFELTIPRDLTLEGAWDGKTPLSTSGNVPIVVPSNLDELWWSKTDLIVSARLDNDGVAATRSPEDLVGRGIWKFSNGNSGKDSGNSVVEIQLTGRGAFGKFATGGNAKT